MHLVVVGAALGTGRWVAEHLLPHAPWRSVTLIDSKTTKTGLGSQSWRLDDGRTPVAFGESIETPDGDVVVREGTRERLPMPDGPTVIWFALPPQVLPAALVEMLPLTDPRTQVVVSASPLAAPIALAREAAAGRPVHGVHPLFDVDMPSLAGQILYVVPDGSVPDWLAGTIAAAHGILKTGSAAEHDRAMDVVQRGAHRTLLDFAERVTGSGLDLERDLWEARTPLFETLFGLAVRALDSRAAVLDPERVREVQDRIPGALYDTIRATAATAVAAAQAKRIELARLWSSGAFVAIGASVGRIVDLTATTVTVENVLVGPAGAGALLAGPGAANAAALGISGRPKRVTVKLSHAVPRTGADLDAILARRLASVRRDVRFLVPESVAGAGVLRVVETEPGLTAVELLDEVVRTGQRAVVIRVGIRADYAAEPLVARLQERVAGAYRWPAGLARTPVAATRRILHLGPAGTFSEDAALLAAAAVGARDAPPEAVADFDAVLAGLGDDTLGVLPITSSSSGLVSRAVEALLLRGSGVAAGGMVDVPIRFDAYARPGLPAEALRGAIVYAHPQSIAQCSAFIQRHRLVAEPVASNAVGLERVLADPRPSVALAGAGRGAAFGLEVAAREVDDLSGSITRFLIVGPQSAFGAVGGGAEPTVRRLWVGRGLVAAAPILGAGGAGLDELLVDAEGRWLLVSSRGADAPAGPDAVPLGEVPWSPRTPVVRAG